VKNPYLPFTYRLFVNCSVEKGEFFNHLSSGSAGILFSLETSGILVASSQRIHCRLTNIHPLKNTKKHQKRRENPSKATPLGRPEKDEEMTNENSTRQDSLISKHAYSKASSNPYLRGRIVKRPGLGKAPTSLSVFDILPL